MYLLPAGLRGAPGYSLEQAHHLPIEMDPLIGDDMLALTAAEQFLLKCLKPYITQIENTFTQDIFALKSNLICFIESLAVVCKYTLSNTPANVNSSSIDHHSQ